MARGLMPDLEPANRLQPQADSAECAVFFFSNFELLAITEFKIDPHQSEVSYFDPH